MRRARAIAVAFASIAALASAALLAWRAHEHGPGPEVDPKSTACPTPTGVQEVPAALLEAKGPGGFRLVDSPSPETAGDAPKGGDEAPSVPGAPRAPAPESVPVTLRLIRSDGGTLERARVRVADDESNGVEWDLRTGTVLLPVGLQTVEVLGGRFGEWRQPEDFQIDVRTGMGPIEITLRPWRMILGRLRLTEGSPSVLAGAQLRVIQTEDGEDAPHDDECKVDLKPPSDGWFSFGRDHELAPGTYVVSATPWVQGPVVASREVVVADAAVAVEIDLPRRARSDGVTLKIEDPEGRPIAPTAVMIDVVDDQGGGGGGGISFERLEEGRYWLPTMLPGYSGRTPVSVTIWVQSSYGERRVDLPLPNSGKDVPVRFEATAQLRLTFTHPEGWLADTDQVEVWRLLKNGRRGVARAALRKDGVARIEGVQPGDYWLAYTRKGSMRGLSTPLGPVSLRSGENDLELATPPLHPLRIHGAKEFLSLSRADAFRYQGTIQWPVGAEIVQLPPGSYTLRSHGTTATVEVPKMSEVTLEKEDAR